MNSNRPTRLTFNYNTLETQGIIVPPTIKTLPNSISPPRALKTPAHDPLYVQRLSSELQHAKFNEQQRLKSSQEKIDTLLNEIENLNGILRKQNSSIHELSSKLSQTELFYQQKLTEQENRTLYDLELQKNLVKERSQEISRQNQIIKQQQIEIDDLYKQIENFNKETIKVKENLKNSNYDNFKFDNQSLKVQILKLQEELSEANGRADRQASELQTKHQQDLSTWNSKILQLNYIIEQYKEQQAHQTKLIEHQQAQIGQLRSTIQMLNASLNGQVESQNQYQELLQNYNQLREQLKVQESLASNNLKEKEIQDYKNLIGNLQQQVEKSTELSGQLQAQNDKLKVMLRNRLNETELWRSKYYQLEQRDPAHNEMDQLRKENEILRQRQVLTQIRCNILEINIKENNSTTDINQLNSIIEQQSNQISHYQKQLASGSKRVATKKQLSSPKNMRITSDSLQVHEFSSNHKKYF